MGDWSGTSRESEANGARRFHGAVEDDCMWPPVMKDIEDARRPSWVA
jgi:hypothetical protein